MLACIGSNGRILHPTGRDLLLENKGAIMRTATIFAIGFLFIAGNMGLAKDKTVAAPAAMDVPSDSAPQMHPPAPPADCQSCKGREAHLQHLLAWALYRPPAHCCCRCLPQPVPCCTPPLYTWFPCQGFVGFSSESCTSCGEEAGPCKTDCYKFFHP